MAKYIPLISSGTAGPLGVLHLPRLWQKASLGATGQLNDEYPACGMGYDQMVLDGLGIDKDTFLNFIAAEKPSYTATEAWVLAQKGGSLDADAVAKLNAAITGYIHDEATRNGILSACGIAGDQPQDAVNLNNLEDWNDFHKEVLAG